MCDYHCEDDLRLRVVGLRDFMVTFEYSSREYKMRTFPPDSDHRPGRSRRLGGDLALIGLVKLSQPTSDIVRCPSEDDYCSTLDIERRDSQETERGGTWTMAGWVRCSVFTLESCERVVNVI